MNMISRVKPGAARGFTLIELLIVVGIISVLLLVLAIAVLPALAKNEKQATRALLQQVGPGVTGRTPAPTLERFRKDAGQLSRRISPDEKIAHSQMMLFYLAPSRSTWDGSELYKNRNYAPPHQPQEFAEFTREEGGGLPYLVDAWGNPLRYLYDTRVKAAFVYSVGPDNVVDSPDDIIFDSRNNQVKTREELQ